MQSEFSIDALLLFWQELPIVYQICLLLAGIVVLWGIFRLGNGFLHFLRTHMLHRQLGDDFDRRQIRQAFRDIFPREGFLPEKGIVPLLPYFSEKLNRENPPESRFYLLLGPSGSGKTTFLLRLYARISLNGLRPKKVKLISLPNDPALLTIQAIPEPGNTILLIDGFDEDPLVKESLEDRLEEVLALTQDSQKVILACSHARFPELKELKSAVYTYVGEHQLKQFQLCELVPLNPAQAKSYIRRKSRGSQKKAQLSLQKNWPDLAATPLSLHTLLANNRGSEQSYYFQLFEQLIDQVLEPKFKTDEALEQANRFLEGVAGSMHVYWQEGKALKMPLEEISALANAFGVDLEKLLKLCLMKIGEDQVAFRHISYLSYFLGQAAYRDELHPELTVFEGLPLARTFYLEMAWLNYLEELPETDAWFRSVYKGEKRSIQELSSGELPQITRLYLSDYRGQDLRFLRMMKYLRAIQLKDGEPADLYLPWVRELPQEKLTVYLGWDPANQQLWTPFSSQGNSGFSDLKHDPSLLPKFREINVRQEMNPLQKLPQTLVPRVFQGRKEILDLFHRNLLEMPDLHCEKIGGRRNRKGERMDIYQCRLGHLELDLFNELEVYVFPANSYNLSFSHTHRPTMLIETIEDMLQQLYAVYGEDDFHKTLLTPHDIAQIEDGIWLGRRWSWQNTDSYAYPVHLYMPQPNQFKLVICGLQSTEISELESDSYI